MGARSHRARDVEREGTSMGSLAQTEGLTDVQQEILAAVHDFVEKEIIPNAQALEHADEYPADIVEGMKAMGVVMKQLQPQITGRADGAAVAAAVKAALGA